jgi:hypothetical protein
MFRLTFLPAIVLGCLPVTDPVKPPEELTLKSSYSRKALVDGARQIRVNLKIDEKGNGTGTIELDPNSIEEWGSTCMAIQTLSVQVQLVDGDSQTAKGRRLYALKETRLDERLRNQPKFYLIRPTQAGASMMLVFVDDAGKFRDVVELK